LQPVKYLLLAIGLVFLGFGIFSDEVSEVRLPVTVISIVCGILAFVFHQTKTVEFDQDFLHIRRRQLYVAVPLHRIVMIGLANMEINEERMWKIVYTDERDEEQSVRILPERKNFRRFTRYMAEHHPGVRVKNWERAFDPESL